MKKLTLKQHWLIANGLMFAGVIISTWDVLKNLTEINWVAMGIAIGLAAVGYIYHLKFVRCPECGARLPASGKFPEKCDKCGESLAKYNK